VIDDKFFHLCDNYLKIGFVTPLHDTQVGVGTPVDGATCTAKLYDDDEVGGPTQLTPTITCAGVGGSSGQYIGTVTDDHAGIDEGMMLRVEYDLDDGSGRFTRKTRVYKVVPAE